MIDQYPAAQPKLGVDDFGQSNDFRRASHPVKSGAQPQRQKYLRGNRHSSHATFDLLDAFVEAHHVLPFNTGP